MLLLLLLLSIICLFNKWRKLFIQLIRCFRISRLAQDDDDDDDDEHWRHDDDDGGGNCYIITAYHKLNELRDG